MLLKEGRFGKYGFVAEGVLGAIQSHFRRIMGGPQAPRDLGESEQMLARAIVCAFLESLGGEPKDGRYELEVSAGQSHTAPVPQVSVAWSEQDFGALVRHVDELGSAISNLPRKEALDASVAALRDQLEKVSEQLNSSVFAVRNLQGRMTKIERALRDGVKLPADEATPQEA